MKTNEAPEKIYIPTIFAANTVRYKEEGSIEYIRADAFIGRVINFLNYKLDDVVAIRVPGTIIPHHIAKQELIEELKKYMKG